MPHYHLRQDGTKTGLDESVPGLDGAHYHRVQPGGSVFTSPATEGEGHKHADPVLGNETQGPSEALAGEQGAPLPGQE